jgi:hypothetical protein
MHSKLNRFFLEAQQAVLSDWTKEFMDETLVHGDVLYSFVVNTAPKNKPIAANGYLDVENCDHVKEEIIFNGSRLSFEYIQILYGSLSAKDGGDQPNLLQALQDLFEVSPTGIIFKTNSLTIAVMKKNGKFSLFNSHSVVDGD